MPSCGGSAFTKSEQNFEFTTSQNSAIPIGTGSSGFCYTTADTTSTKSRLLSQEQALTKYLIDLHFDCGASYDGSCGTRQELAKSMAKSVKELKNQLANESSTVSSSQWRLYPFKIEAKGTLKLEYDANGNLIATITKVHSTLTGTEGDLGSAFQAPLYTGGDFGYALNISTSSADEPTSGWAMCCGGWWSAAQLPCGNSCADAAGNPPGGTMYWWNAWNRDGQKYEKHGNTPGRWDYNLSWNLGKVDTSVTPRVYVWARATRGNCPNATFERNGGVRQIKSFGIPPMNVCPAEILDEEEIKDVCNECVTHRFVFGPNDLIGQQTGTLRIRYVLDAKSADKTNWKNAQDYTKQIGPNQEYDATLPCLKPGRNYCAMITIYVDGANGESEPVYSCFKTKYLPSAKTVVPDLTEEECETIKTCGYINQFGEED